MFINRYFLLLRILCYFWLGHLHHITFLVHTHNSGAYIRNEKRIYELLRCTYRGYNSYNIWHNVVSAEKSRSRWIRARKPYNNRVDFRRRPRVCSTKVRDVIIIIIYQSGAYNILYNIIVCDMWLQSIIDNCNVFLALGPWQCL